jgi:Zn-dependent protease
MNEIFYKIAVNALPMLLAITLHEAAKAYTANYLGDNTAKMMGRVTLNPTKHIDLFGTIILPTLTLIIGGFFFGWPKPIPINPDNLRNPKRDLMWIAISGVGANLVMMILWAFVYKDMGEDTAIKAIAMAGVVWNLSLAVISLLPIPPFAGGRIVMSLLPDNLADYFAKIEPYSFFILIALILTKTLQIILGPLYAVGIAILDGIIK